MQKSEFILEIQSLSAQEDILTAFREAKELKTKFEDFNLEEERKEQVALLENGASAEDFDKRKDDPERDKFYEIYGDMRDKQKAIVESLREQEIVNLKTKRGLLEALKDLIQNEENIGAAFTRKNEINDKWKAAGEVSREKRQEIYSEYQNLNDAFFSNIKIYKMLQENDLRVNQNHKLEIIKQVQALSEVESVKELETRLKSLQADWTATGPTFNEQWPQIKDAYWDNCKIVYARIQEHYEGKREEQGANIEKKKALLEEVKVIVEVACASVKEWEDQTKLVVEKQESWKGIGFGNREENEVLWQELRTVCNGFFDRKKEFYNGLREVGNVVAEKKQSLVNQVAALRNSEEWKATSDKIIQLQKEWKTSGSANRNQEQKLWQEFRGHCDAFFNSKQRHFEEQDKANEGNLIAKLDLIQKIETYVPNEDKKTLLQDLRDFTSSFNTIGKVPMKEKDAVYESYKKAIDSHYSKMKLEGDEKDRIMFESRIETFKASPNAGKLMDKERFDLQQQIQKANQEITQYENNMGFFSKSKGAESMLKEVENKIAAAKKRVDELKIKLSALRNVETAEKANE